MSICTVDGCGKVMVTKGLCGMHRQRMIRHGDVNAVNRPPNWGSGHGHPLYERWRSIRRGGRLAGGNVPRWDDFWNFVEDVGNPESARHKLFRIDETKPYGPDNFEWRARVADSRIVAGDQASRNKYQRDYNRENPHRLKNAYLKRHYGITVDRYEEMLQAQGEVCAICKKGETRIYAKTNEPMMLAVDHDHATGSIRALLCSHCNHGLGNFYDDPALLQAAIAYLASHAPLDVPPERPE